MYSNDMTWSQWQAYAESRVTGLKTSLSQGYMEWQKFYNMTYGLTDAQILALPAFVGKIQTDLNAIRNCFNTFKQLYDAYYGLNAAALPIYNYDAYMISFQQ